MAHKTRTIVNLNSKAYLIHGKLVMKGLVELDKLEIEQILIFFSYIMSSKLVQFSKIVCNRRSAAIHDVYQKLP